MFNRQFTIYRRVNTTLSADKVFNELERSLRVHVGGTQRRSGNTIQVQNGTNNLNFAFVGDLMADITLTQPAAGVVEINGLIVLTPNALFWIAAIAGLFCLWFLWAINVFYFVMDPRINYQLALDRAELGSSGETQAVPFQP